MRRHSSSRYESVESVEPVEPVEPVLPVLPVNRNRIQGCKVRFASNHLIVSGYRVPQMQGVGGADVLLYFKCPTTKQMRYPVNAYG